MNCIALKHTKIFFLLLDHLKRRRDRFETAIFSCQSEHLFTLKSLPERLKRDFDYCKSVSIQSQSML